MEPPSRGLRLALTGDKPALVSIASGEVTTELPDTEGPRPDVGEIRYGAPAGTLPPSLSASARQRLDPCDGAPEPIQSWKRR